MNPKFSGNIYLFIYNLILIIINFNHCHFQYINKACDLKGGKRVYV